MELVEFVSEVLFYPFKAPTAMLASKSHNHVRSYVHVFLKAATVARHEDPPAFAQYEISGRWGVLKTLKVLGRTHVFRGCAGIRCLLGILGMICRGVYLRWLHLTLTITRTRRNPDPPKCPWAQPWNTRRHRCTVVPVFDKHRL